MELFKEEMELIDHDTGKKITINVSQETKKLYETMSDSMKIYNDSMIGVFNKLLIKLSEEAYRNGYYNCDMSHDDGMDSWQRMW